MSKCRSCGQEILWVKTERGKNMPLDPEPYEGDDARGLFVLRRPSPGEDAPVAVAISPAVFTDEKHYRSHFSTCPQADMHRR